MEVISDLVQAYPLLTVLVLAFGPMLGVAAFVELGARFTRGKVALVEVPVTPPSMPVEAEPPARAVEEPGVLAADRVAEEERAEPIPEPILEEAPPTPAPVAKPPASLRERLARTSEFLIGGFERVLMGTQTLDSNALEELEELLFTADLGVKTADSLLERVRRQAAGSDIEAVRAALREGILEKLLVVDVEIPEPIAGDGPYVILVLGVNGAGKTTTIGKLAARYQAAGKKVLLGAGDTFRAAATEQLQAWGERVGCDVVAGTEGGDPAAVAFDALKAGVARGADIVIIDTAGRLQTKGPLVEELKKIVRVIKREVDAAPHETLLVLDANTGQNAISQTEIFTEAAGVTGLVLTKLDGTAKGGVLVGLADQFGIPVRYVGVGEAVEDLREFSAPEFVDALFGSPPET